MSDYQMQKKLDYTSRFRNILSELPDFCALYFRAVEPTTSVLTRYGYAVDLRKFFRFLTSGEIERFSGKLPKQLKLSDMELLSSLDIELYLEYISLYREETQDGQKLVENNERAKSRKLSAIRSLFKFLYKKSLIQTNCAALVDTPKLHEKAIIRLEANEVADLLDTVEQGSGMTTAQRRYHDATKLRDVAILSLFLGTGIRISELVGIDLDDIDFSKNEFIVTRKGGNQMTLAFGPEVAQALLEYLEERKTVIPFPGHETAFFLSMQRKRITPRAVENLVKKYAKISTPLKKITPHKLRSTYGTMLYQESGDIYLVADVLGHKDVNTTRKHYAAMTEEKSHEAAKYIKLRENTPEFPADFSTDSEK
jgi:site-specific recombinase XerD